MTHNCSREHDRELERHAIQGDVDVYDNLRNQYIGRLVNVHIRGLMIVGDIAMEEDRLYTLDLHLPEAVNGQTMIQLGRIACGRGMRIYRANTGPDFRLLMHRLKRPKRYVPW